MGSNGAQPHALVIPLPQAGHWNPMKTFIRQLVCMKISLTVVSTPSTIAELQHWKDNGEFERLEHAEFLEVFPDPPNKRNNGIVETSRETCSKMKADYREQPALKESLIAQISAGYGPTFLVADMLLSWTQEIADQLGIPRYTFFTSPTSFALVTLHAPSLLAIDYDSIIPHKRDEIVNLPGLEVFRLPDVPKGKPQYPAEKGIHSENLKKAAGIVINSFEYYEHAEAAALRACLEKDVGTGKIPKVYLIGPVQCLPIKPLGHSKKELTAETDNSGCLRFLDTQKEASVLFICFGSQVSLDEPSIIELARGLELSEVAFLWIVPCPAQAANLPSWDVSDILPEGFLTRTRGRGLVSIEWAPQKEILEHSSTGGFISHCGWNSLVETIRAGVAVIPWPTWADQQMNARFLVEVAKVGVNIQPTPDGRFAGPQIAEAVRLLMMSDKGKETKLKMKELQKAVELATVDGGSSTKALRAFHEDILSIGH